MTTQAAERRQFWEDLCEQADAYLRDNADLLQRFRGALAGLFTGMAEGRQFGRRPNISLRLIADGAPPAKVIAVPGWDHREKTLDCGHLVCELLAERDVETRDGPAKKRTRRAGLWVSEDGRVRSSLVHPDVLTDLARVLGTVRSFLDDSRAVLARSHDQCCICGRALTDGLSRARGIGPECVQRAAGLAVLGGPGLVQAE